VIVPGSAPLLARRRERTALAEHHAKITVHLRALFAEEPRRGERITAEGAGLHLDYSKHRITGETLRLLPVLGEAMADFASKGLSAMRCRFGGHIERPAGG
jgi:glucose-6-phosphate isomerase